MATLLLKKGLLAVAFLVVGACASTKAPQVSHDGLELRPDSKVDQLYVRPGASLQGYQEVGLVPCQVAFRKNWMRDQNSNHLDFGSRVTQKDVDRIKDALAASCDQQFTAALQKEPAYPVVQQFVDGEAVLILRPSIINLDINAPDTLSASRSRSYTTSAGEMTLVLEVLDGTTGEVLARAIDRQRGMDSGRLEWTNGVTNRADADRMLRRWSDRLRAALDSARAN